MKITFAGAARTVTGSKHLLETKDGLRILLDCGLYQGKESRGSRQNDQFNFDPESIDMVFLSHAHIDHSGLLPKLVKEGFSGPIYCTEPTKSLCEIMLADSAYIQMNDYAYSSKQKEETDTSEPLYTIDDVVATLDLFQPIPYNSWQEVREGVTVMLTYVGHIIGSACVNLRLIEGRKTHKIAYTGDIGRAKHQIIKGFEPFPQAEIIIT
ncbi:MAG TPA: MBL fold metallo-hydrolase, partial [Cryomorphaceae bacterium]|nr:MBL fold metallo-hydrolase [Cryomorphaceae bacterium]